jgi:hypothetical protein
MRLTDFQQHLFAENIKFAFRFEDLDSDVYKNPKSGKKIRINIQYDEIPDMVALTYCYHLEIDVPPDLDDLHSEVLAKAGH